VFCIACIRCVQHGATCCCVCPRANIAWCKLHMARMQVDIRGFTEPLPLLSSPTRYNGKLPAGMLNHGNTCYLNAVLQVRTLTGRGRCSCCYHVHVCTHANTAVEPLRCWCRSCESRRFVSCHVVRCLRGCSAYVSRALLLLLLLLPGAAELAVLRP
jgi:hypothetical protein